MNSITPQVQAIAADRILNRNPATLGQSLNRLAFDSKVGLPAPADTSGPAVFGKFDPQGKRVQAAMTSVQEAISAVQAVDGYLGGMGEIIERLQLAAVSLQVESGNLASVITPIRDEAGAEETTARATSGVLTQPEQAMLAQANVGSEGVFRLLER